jgi:ribosomal peptide maturation radical SAM protein 1
MLENKKSLLLVSMPFAETSVPSIQLALLESYLKERDVTVSTRHLYVKAAEFYGLTNYNFLINSPNDPYAAQMVFSKYVFPDHWIENLEKFRFFYDNIIDHNQDFFKQFSFEEYVKQTDAFFDWTINNVDWKNYDLIGFSLNYGQILPSLAVAKKIKENFPEKKIVFGGSTTINELGKKIASIFTYIDFIVSGEGEEALFLLCSDVENYHHIPGLIYREKGNVVWNKNTKCLDMNTLPYPNFQSYLNELGSVSNDILQYHYLQGRIPIELSRGCWWNNCSFCNVSAYHKKYREKNIDRFIDELLFLSEIYHMLDFQVIGSTLPKNNYKTLCEHIIRLHRDFTLIIESRAGSLKSNDYSLLSKAGFTHIQTGIEAFSPNYLKKMKKGTKVIDNIAALKFCKENHIKNSYNLITNYPNEEKIDFEETEKIIKLFSRYLEPPSISKFALGYQSPIYNNVEEYNIQTIEPKLIDTIMYPKELLEKNFCFFYSFKRRKKITENPWEKLVSEWKTSYNEQKMLSLKRDNAFEELVFYYKDGGNFIKIYDKRYGDTAMIYMLNSDERKVFLACSDVISLQELKDNLNMIHFYKIKEKLNDLIEAGIVYKENDWYLSLPISYQKYYNKDTNGHSEDIEEIRAHIREL